MSEPAEKNAPTTENTVDATLLMSRVTELETKLAEATDKTLRAMAEAENTRKRAEKERQDVSKFAVSSFARDILGISDNLRRALQAMTPDAVAASPALKNLLVGVEATERELQRVLESHGIRRVDPLGQKFDANLHEVMFEADSADKPPGTVIQVIDCGYTIHERLLRPARVGIAKGGSPAEKLDQQA
jgi:molecular chaperone GrpE